MQGSISGDALFAQILMHRQVDARLCLLVEGDDELAVLTGHINEVDVLFLMGGGKPAVLKAAQLLDKYAQDRALALVDRDLDDFTGKSASYPDSLVATTNYDLDADILEVEPELIRRAAVAQAGRDVLERIERSCAKPFFDLLIELTTLFAGLRLANETHSFGLNLRSFPFSDVVGSDFRLVATEEIVGRANARSSVNIEYEKVQGTIESAQTQISQGVGASGGHDIFSAAAAVLLKAGAKNVSISQLSASVHTATSCGVLSRLRIFHRIDEWASRFSANAFSC